MASKKRKREDSTSTTGHVKISISPKASVSVDVSKNEAIKAIKITKELKLSDLYPSLDHQNLLKISDLHSDKDNESTVVAVMPFCSGGSLRSIMPFLSKRALSEKCIAAVLKPVLSAVAYLHSRGITHGDIKLGNILVNPESSPAIMLADLEVSESRYYDENEYEDEKNDRPYWKQVEEKNAAVLKENVAAALEKIVMATEIWTFGVTAMELAFRGPPISSAAQESISESMWFRIRKRFGWSIEHEKKYRDKAVVLDTLSDDFQDMVRSCLALKPSKRPSAKKLLEHPFFSKIQDSDSLVKRTLMNKIPSVKARKNELDVGPEVKVDRSSRKFRVGSWEINKKKFELRPDWEEFPSKQKMTSSLMDFINGHRRAV